MCNLARVILFFLSPALVAAQTELSGIINVYARVLSIDTCLGKLQLDAAEVFAPGQAVIIIQMQGARMRLDDSERFGDLVSLDGAGLWERARIASVEGAAVFLTNTLVNEYDPAGKVQLVSLPEYAEARVTAPLRARAWNGAAGGVLALAATARLTLEADIDVSAQGFRGGSAEIATENNCNALQRHQRYAYELGNWRGAMKGEGVAAYAQGGESGRGPQLNGGGGGNDHNAGGGGGAHLTLGGQGGENRQTGLGCRGLFPGLGGKALPAAATRLFMGGGGGAGHENNRVGTDGGAGGGIVILLTPEIISGPGKAIRANGDTPPSTVGDGGGGGGAAGSIYLLANELRGELLLEARGGGGGDIDNRNGPRCFGPGGGGAGGRIIAPAAFAAAVDFSGGPAGLSRNSTICPDGPNNASAGSQGNRETPGAVPASDMPVSPPAIVGQPEKVSACEGQTASMAVGVAGHNLSYQWQMDSGQGFVDISDDLTFANTRSNALTLREAIPALDGRRFRLRARSPCFGELLSAPIALTVRSAPRAGFSLLVDERTIDLIDESEHADYYRWDFGDGTAVDEPQVRHIYENDGEYLVKLVVSNACGVDSAHATTIISTMLSAAFTSDHTEGCAPFSTQLRNLSSRNAVAFQWRFPGGVPAESTENNPTVRYESPGSYDVTLIALGDQRADTLTLPEYFLVEGPPRARFSATVDEQLRLRLDNDSEAAETYRWDFGDGNSAAGVAPDHTYARPGRYTVVLSARNVCGIDSVSLLVTAGAEPQAAFTLDYLNGCAPHTVRFQNLSQGVHDSFEWSFPGGRPAVSNEPNPVVVYEKPGDYAATLVISGALGASTTASQQLIKVRDYPEPAFTFTQEGLTVVFLNQSENADAYRWHFGDGGVSEDMHPTHVYAASGVYVATLNALNGVCANAMSRTISLMLTAAHDRAAPPALHAFPNPTDGYLYLGGASAGLWPLHCRIHDARGRLLRHQTLSGEGAIDFRGLPPAVYLLQVWGREGEWTLRVLKR
jgi:PKD repeat protein